MRTYARIARSVAYLWPVCFARLQQAATVLCVCICVIVLESRETTLILCDSHCGSQIKPVENSHHKRPQTHPYKHTHIHVLDICTRHTLTPRRRHAPSEFAKSARKVCILRLGTKDVCMSSLLGVFELCAHIATNKTKSFVVVLRKTPYPSRQTRCPQ